MVLDIKTYNVAPREDIQFSHDLSHLDLNYIQTGNSIGIGYVFEDGVDVERLKTSLRELLYELPVLAGRLESKAHCVSDTHLAVPFEHVTKATGSISDLTACNLNISNRTDYVPEPSRRDILRGVEPLMCVRLTEFSGGGSVLGVTINHGLMDAAGMHLVMRRWSDLYMGRESDSLSRQGNIYKFSTSRTRKERQKAIRQAGMAKPLNGNTLLGKAVMSTMFMILDGIRKRGREMIYFSPKDVRELKANVHAESGLDWVSTNVAISAHILHAIVPLQLPKKARGLTVGNVINIRGRVPCVVCEDQSSYLGNALYIYVSETQAETSAHDLSRGEIARFLRGAFDKLTPDHITHSMQNIVDSLEDGYGYPGLNIFKPIMAVNNQSKFDVYNVDFGAGRPLRVIPQDVGDHIMIFPASGGGVEVYIRDFVSIKRQKKLLEPEWQERLLTI